MKKITLLFLITISCINYQLYAFQQQRITTPEIENEKIDRIYSENLKEERTIWIHIPKDTSKKHPVLYILDGNTHFEGAITLMKHLVRHNQIPEMIIVAIPNTNRMLDLTPTVMEESRDGRSIPEGTNGGGERFTAFLDEELIPYIEKAYSATSHRTFIGHSLGGLLVLNTLIHHPELFSSYIAIDPSLWWDNQELLKKATNILKQKKFKNKSLFMAVANTLRENMDITLVKQDTSDVTTHIRSILKFNETAIQNNQNKLKFKWKYYEKENHGSIPLIAEYDGLKSVFSWYYFNINDEFRKPIATPDYLINFIEEHYKKRSEYFGYTVKPDEGFINQLGYRFLNPNPKSKAKSLAFFKFNIKNYPKNPNVYDSMADYYENQNDFINALKFAAKAYEISNSKNHKERIELLKKRLK